MKTLLLTLVLMTSAQAFSQTFKTSNYNDYVSVQTKLTQIAMAKIRPEHVEEFKQIVDGLLNKMRAQTGNISYEYSQSQEDPTEFLFHEKWINGASIKNHMESRLVQDFFGKVGGFFEAGYPQLVILKEQNNAQ